MGTTLGVFSSAEITEEEFTTFLQSIGAVITPSGHPLLIPISARLSQGDYHVWIALDPSTLDDALADLAEEGATVWLEWMEQQLGGPPRTCIVLETATWTTGAEQVALTFVLAFAERWLAVVHMFDGATFYSVDDIAKLYQAGQGFPKE